MKETVYKLNDHPNQVFFITKGRIYLVNEDLIPFKAMICGSYFGEIEIIFKVKRLFTTLAAEDSELLTISKQAYEAVIINEFPEVHEELKYIANIRSQKNSEAELLLNKTLNAKVTKPNAYCFFRKKNIETWISEVRKLRRGFNIEIADLPVIRKLSAQLSSIKPSLEKSYIRLLLLDKDSLLISPNKEFSVRSAPRLNLRISRSQDQSFDDLLAHEENFENKPKSNPQLIPIQSYYKRLVRINKEGQKLRKPSIVLKEIVKKKLSHSNVNSAHSEHLDYKRIARSKSQKPNLRLKYLSKGPEKKVPSISMKLNTNNFYLPKLSVNTIQNTYSHSIKHFPQTENQNGLHRTTELSINKTAEINNMQKLSLTCHSAFDITTHISRKISEFEKQQSTSIKKVQSLLIGMKQAILSLQ